MRHLVFGNASAENDSLLYACSVRFRSPDAAKPILTGRWGTGKSALLLLDGEEVTELLQSRVWYIKEQSLDLASLLNIERQLVNDQTFLRRTLETAWRGEIILTYCRVLSGLSTSYRNARGNHWAFIHRVAKSGTDSMQSVWTQLPTLVEFIMGKDRGKGVQEIQSQITLLYQNNTLENIQNCLDDIQPGEPVPIIAVEPIETPTSPIEENTHLADELITALLNVFHQDFQPSDSNKKNIRITLPWHRYNPERIDFPQKLRQYIGKVKWNRKSLREFINRRIEWEFQRVGRRFAPRHGHDAWRELFGDKIVNGLCKPLVYEDSFDYFIRHTHHRARDLQNLARKAVEHQAEVGDQSIDEVLARGSISEETVKEMFRSECPEATRELIIEAQRRYPELRNIKEHLKGLPALPK
ncbi:MAG: hypothetical protein SFU83_05865 [Meiothermus sp.]|nr:hypothetical protein [Meiothermus sp.]